MDPNPLYGIPAKEIAERCHVHVRTARRWKQGTRRTPKLAAMFITGDLGHLDPGLGRLDAARRRARLPRGMEGEAW